MHRMDCKGQEASERSPGLRRRPLMELLLQCGADSLSGGRQGIPGPVDESHTTSNFSCGAPTASPGPSADVSSLSLPLCPFLHRPERERAATSVDTVCNLRPDPTGAGLDRERLYRELSQLTQGVTKLGPYTLDQDSLCVNGELWPPLLCCIAEPSFSPCMPFIPSPHLTALSFPFSLQVTPTRLQKLPPVVSTE